MDRAEQLHFQRLPAEAQHEALWRLALSGMTVEQVAQKTGWSVERIRRTPHLTIDSPDRQTRLTS